MKCFVIVVISLVLIACTAEQLQHFNEGLTAFNCGMEGRTDCSASTSAPAQSVTPTPARPAQEPNLAGSVESIFEDVTWAQLKGERRVARGWRVVGADGQGSMAAIEIVFVNYYRDVNHWCQNVIEAVIGNANKSHPACGCTRPGPPWRIVAIGVPQSGCQSPSYVLAHELWHTKGYWAHIPDAPCAAATGVSRTPQACIIASGCPRFIGRPRGTPTPAGPRLQDRDSKDHAQDCTKQRQDQREKLCYQDGQQCAD